MTRTNYRLRQYPDGHWRCRAYRADVLVAEATGATELDALQACERALETGGEA